MKTHTKLLLVTGLMRSGTTMLANFLNSQDKITIFRDYGFFLNLLSNSPFSRFEAYKENYKNIVIANAKAEAKSQASVNLDIDPNNITSIYDIYKEFLLPISDEDDIIIGNKLTNATNLLKKMLNFPDFLGIYIYRDIRSVLNSGKNRFFKDSYSINYQVYQWKQELRLINDLDAKHKNLLVIKYEDFVLGYKRDDLEKFIGIKLNWKINKFKDRKNNDDNWVGNTSFSNLKQEELKGIYKSNINSWSNNYSSDSDIQYADFICRKELTSNNYKPHKHTVVKQIHFTYKYLLWLSFYKIKIVARIFLPK